MSHIENPKSTSPTPHSTAIYIVYYRDNIITKWIVSQDLMRKKRPFDGLIGWIISRR
jgi:hypothetical protein